LAHKSSDNLRAITTALSKLIGRKTRKDRTRRPLKDELQESNRNECWMKTLPKVASEMALSVLAYNLTRVMNIVGTTALMAAIRA
jgi:hypothetical protein